MMIPTTLLFLIKESRRLLLIIIEKLENVRGYIYSSPGRSKVLARRSIIKSEKYDAAS